MNAAAGGKKGQATSKPVAGQPVAAMQPSSGARPSTADARQACMSQPITPERVAQTNPFTSHAQTFSTLLQLAEGRCAGSKTWAEWQACIGDNASGALWAVEGPAQTNHSDLFRRYRAAASEFKGKVCLDQPVSRSRNDCMLTSGSLEVVRSNCAARLRQDVDQMNCDAEMLPSVWAAENGRKDADAAKRRDEDCKRRFP
jgi:hypothetical protein